MKARLPILLALFLASSSVLSGQEGPPRGKKEPPTTAEIVAFARSLEKARRSGKKEERLELLRRALWMDDARVSEAVGPYLKSTDSEIRKAAIRALRYHETKTAFRLLIKAAADKAVRKDAESMAELCLALGQCGEKAAIPVLTDDVWSNIKTKVFRARCMALAHIREKEAVDALVKLVRMGKKGGRRRSGAGRMKPAYQALTLLTGQRIQPQAHLWKKWWDQNRAAFEVPREPTGLRKKEARQWERLWRKPVQGGKARKPRRRRGGEGAQGAGDRP